MLISHFHVGLTALSYSFGKFKMDPDPKPYNLFYFRGSNNFNIGVDYMLKSNRIKFYGETALSKNGAISTLNALQLTPLLIYLSWYYTAIDRRYQALFRTLSRKALRFRMSKGFIWDCN